IRYSAPGPTNAVIHIEIDGQDVTGAVALPVTGGWFNWATSRVLIPQNIAAGLHNVKVVFRTGRMNFYWMEFTGMPRLVSPAAIWLDQDVNTPLTKGYSVTEQISGF